MRATFSRRAALALLGAAAGAGSARADPGHLAAAVEDAVRPLLARHGVPGIALGVTLGGRRAVFPFGTASRRTGAPVTDDTLFEVGSISKVFAATLAAEAEARGALKLDARVESLVPELRGTPIGRASLLHLCTYTAGGLPLQFPDGVEDEAGALAYFRQWQPAGEPGTLRRYSNPSIVLLGLAVARALGYPLAEAIEADLFPRLGLRRSIVRASEADMERYGQGYDGGGNPIRLRPGTFPAAAYGVKATAADMLGFLEANLFPERLEPRLGVAVRDTQRGRYRVGQMIQGLGWEIYPDPPALDRLLAGNAPDMALRPHPAERLDPPAPREGAFLNKTGSTNGFGAYIALSTEKGCGIALLANRSLPIPARVTAAHAVLKAATDG